MDSGGSEAEMEADDRGELGTPPDVSDEARAVQAVLPLDLDSPIPFELTARARRAVAPGSLPPLEVVDVVPADPAHDLGEPDDLLEDPNDTRPARARALRRAGMSVMGIASELDVEPTAVTAWIDDLEPVASARRRLRAVDGGRVAAARDLRAAAAAERAQQRYDEVRRAANDEIAADLADEDGRLAGLALLAGIAYVDTHAILVRTREQDVAAAASSWLRTHLVDDPSRLRVVLRISPQVPADLVRRSWADALGIRAPRVTTSRWRSAPGADAVEATIRLADPEAAGRFAGWRDALVASLSGD